MDKRMVKDYVLDALHQEGITHIFMVPGGLIDPFLTAFDTSPIVPIVAAHEGGAAYMADGYARAGGKFGVCLCIGGPGISNTVTAIYAAATDQIPILLISGEVPASLEGMGGFQDSSAGADMCDMDLLRPLTADSLTVEHLNLLPHHFHKVLKSLLQTVHRPVHLSLPKDIQQSEISFSYQKLPVHNEKVLNQEACEKIWPLFAESNKTVMLVGGGVEKSNATKELLKFAESFHIPVATTLRAKGIFPEDHELSLGVFGYAGTRHAIETLLTGEVETLIVVGSGLNQRDTLFWHKNLQPRKYFIQVDTDIKNIGEHYTVHLPILADANEFFHYLNRADMQKKQNLAKTIHSRKIWLDKIKTGDRLYGSQHMKSTEIPIHPARAITDLRKMMPRDTVVLVDSGAHRAFAAQYWEAYEPRHYLSATNLGPMGFAIPAAIGAKLARPELPCVVITGDGCMLMHGMEIQTAARYQIPIIYVVMNNSALANVYLRAKKQSAGAMRLTETAPHDWSAFAEALGVTGMKITKPEQLEETFTRALKLNKPVLVEVIVGKDYITPVCAYQKAQAEWHE